MSQEQQFQSILVGDEELQFPIDMSDEQIRNALESHTGTAEKPKTPTRIEEGWYDDPVMAARMVLDGFAMSWDDEIAGAFMAGYQKVIGNEEDYDTLYRAYQEELDADKKQYAQDHPVAATALGVTGSLLMPVKGAVTLGAKATQGAIMGAVSGAGSASAEQVEEGALSGAGFGATASLALSGIGRGTGALWNGVSKRRIEESLRKEDGSFTPITLADADKPPTMLQGIYRDFFGGTLIVSKGFKEAETKIIDEQKSVVDLAQESLDVARTNVKNSLQDLKDSVQLDKRPALAEEVSEVSRRAAANAREAKEGIRTAQAAVINKAEANAVARFDEAVESQSQAFRRKAVANSLPAGLVGKDIDRILDNNDMLSVVARLDEKWAADGFQSIHNNTFKFKTQEIADKIKQQFKDSDEGLLYRDADIDAMASDIIEKMATRKAKNGSLEGSILANLRSSLGRSMGKLGDTPEDQLRAGLMKRVQNVIDDDVIRPQLAKLKNGQQALKDFDADIASYGHLTILRDATKAAGRSAQKQGAFDAQDWLNAATRNSGILTRRGENRLQRDAYGLVNTLAARDTVLKDTSKSVIRRANKAAEADLKRVVRVKEQQIADARKRASEQGRQLTRDVKSATRLADANPEVVRLTQELDIAKDRLSNLNARSAVGRGDNVFRQLAATGVVPALAGLSLGSSLGTGVLISKLANSQTSQRIFAGQTSPQQAMAKFSEKYGNVIRERAETAGAVQGGMFGGASATVPEDPLSQR